MITKLACGAVGLVAISIGLYDYWSFISDVCHKGIHTPHKYLATKTPYMYQEPYQQGDYETSCEPLQLWMVVRHGTRNPSAKVIDQMKQILPSIRIQILKSQDKGNLCEEARDGFMSWTLPSISLSDEKLLVSQGEAELRGIGSRFRKRFPSLMPSLYSNTTYKLKYTKTERAASSAKFFVDEVLGTEEASRVEYPEPLNADPILRFYKGCPKWKKEIKKNPTTYSERLRFENGHLFQSMIKKIDSRLGLANGLSVEDIEIMYMTCAFETAWTPTTPSPWCHVFDEDDLELMQYRQDLEYYWVDGYGYELTYLQACPAVKDLLHHLSEKVSNSKDTPSLIAYFTHSGTTLKLLARFGLFNDTIPLLHDNFAIQKNRMWKTSQVDKFATNLAFALYNCSGENRVGLLFQEQNVPIPGCGDKHGLCTLSEFVSQYDPIVNNCDIQKMCAV